jgi:Fur family zinc uptake transcriptional regulator
MFNSDRYGHCVTAPSGDFLVALLDEAAARCARAGAALTAGRHRVLELLTAAGRPLKAYDAMAIYYSEGRVIRPITFYRALDFLVR